VAASPVAFPATPLRLGVALLAIAPFAGVVKVTEGAVVS